VSLSNEMVLNVLKQKFVVGFKNITGESYAGKSGRHAPTAPAVETTNGAGPHNVQLFVLSADGTVLHCLPGYWHPQDLVTELRFALELDKLWRNPILATDAKQKQFAQAHREIIRNLPVGLIARSHLQSFDAKHEEQKKTSDFRFASGDFRPAGATGKNKNLKPTVQVVHERMAQRPFVAYEKFDVEHFSDYGKWRYDKKEETREGPAVAVQPRKKKR
jgi:hypothetical protein